MDNRQNKTCITCEHFALVPRSAKRSDGQYTTVYLPKCIFSGNPRNPDMCACSFYQATHKVRERLHYNIPTDEELRIPRDGTGRGPEPEEKEENRRNGR